MTRLGWCGWDWSVNRGSHRHHVPRRHQQADGGAGIVPLVGLGERPSGFGIVRHEPNSRSVWWLSSGIGSQDQGELRVSANRRCPRGLTEGIAG